MQFDVTRRGVSEGPTPRRMPPAMPVAAAHLRRPHDDVGAGAWGGEPCLNVGKT